MGNSHSNTTSHGAQPRTLGRKKSTAFNALSSLACTASSSAASMRSSGPPSEIFVISEKARYRDSDENTDYDSAHYLPQKPLVQTIVRPRPSLAPLANITNLPQTKETPSPATRSAGSHAYAPGRDELPEDTTSAYRSFLREFPEYRLTWIVDTLRRTDYSRLANARETYVDYMGGALYPESLIRVHADFLSDNILGNTHSVSNSSKLSLQYADEAREAVLSFFQAPSSEYTVIFTNNATGALKLVGESFPFTQGSTYALGADSHNSVHGIREFARMKGARVTYVPCTLHGGFDPGEAKTVLSRNRPHNSSLVPSLFAMTGQSNITNSKNPLSMLSYASSLGYHTLLDAAALAPTSTISLANGSIDAMAVSFYKMFGFPTGVGALVAKKSFLEKLKRPWFAGGTVDVVQVPGNIVTRAHDLHEQFEDGTINYLTLPAVTDGLRFLTAYLPFLPLRLSCLMHYFTDALSRLRHDTSGTPVVRILSRPPGKRVKSVNKQSTTGSTISLIFLNPAGEMLPNSFIEYSASKERISLRTGCMCNPGGAASILGITDDMRKLYPGVTLKDFERFVGRELGVVRISLGLASNFEDVWNVLRFAKDVGTEKRRAKLWDAWMEASEVGVGQAF